jgi:aspartyl-tRNA(Asn)/glutamyl-tRNA(Gln) amidotransferase subunit C
VPDQFTEKDVDRLAQLARLALTADERHLFARQLADFLAYANEVRQVDTTGVAPTSHATTLAIGLRDDCEEPSLDRTLAVGAAPEAAPQAGLFKVPRVIG